MSEKLNDFSKILLATSAINYMASQIDSVNKEMKAVQMGVPKHAEAIQSNIDYRNGVLLGSVQKLAEIMNELGDCMSNNDIVMPIDEKITTPAFDIIVHGEDAIEPE